MLDLKALADNVADLPVRRWTEEQEPSFAGTVRTYVFRSVEDPECPPERAACAGAPFEANLWLGGSLWSVSEREGTGRVLSHFSRKIGRATACARITDTVFPSGLRQEFYTRFDLPEGSFSAVGECTLISNEVPVPGLVLASCHLQVVTAPRGVAGGAATSMTVFNPLRIPGFVTGSLWTLQVFYSPTP